MLLTVWMIYPALKTFQRGFWSNQGDKFVWFQNYSTMFGDSVIHTAIQNNISLDRRRAALHASRCSNQCWQC